MTEQNKRHFGWIQKWIQNLLGRVPPASSPPQERTPLEPVTLHTERDGAGVHDTLVVDFGTTATVIGVVRERNPNNPQALNFQFLVGETEYVSEMSIDHNSNKVHAVGPDAYLDASNRNHKLVTSMKRYLELDSRGTSNGDFQSIVRDYFRLAVENKFMARNGPVIGEMSTVTISVPNSFSASGIDFIRNGILAAIQDINRALDSRDNRKGKNARTSPGAEKVKIVREGEAIAYLYSRQDAQLTAPVNDKDGTFAAFEWDLGEDADTEDEQKVLIFDVGGGTTDLSLARIRRKTESVKVILSVGVPLGGSDVEKLILRELLNKKDDPSTIKTTDWEIDKRVALLSDIRQYKDKFATSIFTAPEGQDDPLPEAFKRWLEQISPEGSRRYITDNGVRPEDIDSFRKGASARLNRLLLLSVDGLFNQLDDDARSGISRILLTGRASKLPGIVDAVNKQAEKFDTKVQSLRHDYHAKLAVAYGCALLHFGELLGSRVPTRSFGRRFRVMQENLSPLIDLSADLPVSGDWPTIFRADIAGANRNSSRFVPWEHMVSAPREVYAGEEPMREEEMRWLGCGRPLDTWDLHAGDKRSKYLVWDPNQDIYYSPRGDTWDTASQRDTFTWSDRNCVTGLPLGFPHEKSQFHNPQAEKEHAK
jgi:molecular chaperone DnaK (HSP70)